MLKTWTINFKANNNPNIDEIFSIPTEAEDEFMAYMSKKDFIRRYCYGKFENSDYTIVSVIQT